MAIIVSIAIHMPVNVQKCASGASNGMRVASGRLVAICGEIFSQSLKADYRARVKVYWVPERRSERCSERRKVGSLTAMSPGWREPGQLIAWPEALLFDNSGFPPLRSTRLCGGFEGQTGRFWHIRGNNPRATGERFLWI